MNQNPGRAVHRSTRADTPEVDRGLIAVALDLARSTGRAVADLPVTEIARAAGMSRSTLLRRLGGSRAALDDAVRASGADIGGRPPVRVRAVEAMAWLLDETDLASTTMEAVATRAECSVESLYSVFGSRDELLRATFERFSPLTALQQFVSEPHPEDLRETVVALYRTVAAELTRRPRVMPSVFAEVLSRPEGSAAQTLLAFGAPRMLAALGSFLQQRVDAGQLRDLPLPLLVQQLGGPFLMYIAASGAVSRFAGAELPDSDTAAELFADTFLRAVGAPA